MNNKLLLGIAVGAVAIALIFIAIVFFMQRDGGTPSVVYMTTGEVYVGKLTTFPRLILRDGYQFQAVQNPEEPSGVSSRLIPFSDAAWAPSILHINEKQVVFYGPLSEESAVFKALTDKDSTGSEN